MMISLRKSKNLLNYIDCGYIVFVSVSTYVASLNIENKFRNFF